MRLLTWNVRQGGGRRVGAIASAIASLSPDVVVLTEYRLARNGLDACLASAGWTHQLGSSRFTGHTGVLVASTTPLEHGDVVFDSPVDGHRWVHVRAPAHGWDIGGAYIPGHQRDSNRKQHYWDWLLAVAPDLARQPTVITGDLNTGLHFIDETGATFRCADRMVKLLERGWTDAFRSLHADAPARSWWSSAGNGFRLDHALLSPSAPAAVTAWYVTEHGDQVLASPSRAVPALSDHAAFIVDLPTRDQPT